ncbi:MAG TPA: hypothetical protein VML01_04205, partial [Bryobacterales bacterium]|nr:hypothetical protein [Bryobacterales bacterium]
LLARIAFRGIYFPQVGRLQQLRAIGENWRLLLPLLARARVAYRGWRESVGSDAAAVAPIAAPAKDAVSAYERPVVAERVKTA